MGVTRHFQCRPFAVNVVNKRKSSVSQNGGSSRTGMAAHSTSEKALQVKVQQHPLMVQNELKH